MHTKRALPCIQTPHLAAFGSVLRLLSHRTGNPAAGFLMRSSEGGAFSLSEGERLPGRLPRTKPGHVKSEIGCFGFISHFCCLN